MSTQWRDWCRWARAVSDAITTSSGYHGFLGSAGYADSPL
jgi:hypothetical protein